MHLDEDGPPHATPLLLLHGGGVAGWMWNDLRDRLVPTRRLLIPDLPGHGRSAGSDYVSHESTVDQLAEILAGETRPVAVVGFSLGAQLTVLLAARYPELVDRALVVSAQAAPVPLVGATLGLLRATAGLARREWFARLQARELFVPEQLFPEYFATSSAIRTGTLVAAVGENIRFLLPDDWARFPGRVLVMVGERERRLMRTSAALVAAAVPGARLEVVDGAGHGIPFQRAEWFAAEVEGWLGGS
jgi:pimeloyl-ACP methyl ester carboxylesterase